MKQYETAKAIRAELLAGNATEEDRALYVAIRKGYAADRDALVAMHNKGFSPAITVADLVEAIGYEEAAEIVAMMVICKGNWDGRIDNRRRAWAAEIVTATADELRDVLDLYYSDSIHPAHLDQIAAAMMAYTPAEATNEAPATVKTLDLLKDLDPGDYGDRLTDYRDSSSYICDAIQEIADSNTSIYYSDIMDFVRERPDALADVIAEGLYDPSNKYDFYEHAQAAEFMTIERDIYDHLADSLMMAAVNFIRYDLDAAEIPEELADLLRKWCDDADDGDRMDEIPDRVREYLADFTEEV